MDVEQMRPHVDHRFLAVGVGEVGVAVHRNRGPANIQPAVLDAPVEQVDVAKEVVSEGRSLDSIRADGKARLAVNEVRPSRIVLLRRRLELET
jgi:hypothetical protein